jgi:hypothetical protein
MAKLPLRRNEKLMGALVIGVPMFFCPLLGVIPFGTTPPDFHDQRSVFRYHDGNWAPGPKLAGGIGEIQVSGDGSVWTTPRARGGLSRLDGDHWTWYGRRDFGSSSNWLRGGFAVRATEVWGATDDGVVRFDGRSWRLYPEALQTDAPAAIVAGTSGVWVIDAEGNLSHFDGSAWTIRSLKDIMPALPGEDDDDDPRLALTAKGALWVQWHGLWRQDGDAWRAIQPTGLDVKEAWLLSGEAENVWMWSWGTGEVAALTPEGRVAARHALPQTGPSARYRVDRLVAAGGSVWMAGSTGLLLFADGRLQNFGPPPGCRTVTDVALAPDGSIWAIGESRPLLRIAGFVGPPLAACAAALIVIGLVISAWLQGRAENRLERERAVVAAAGPLPGLDLTNADAEIARRARSVRWILCAFLVGFPFLLFGVSTVVSMPAAGRLGLPRWELYIAVLAAVAVVGFGVRAVVLRLRGSERKRDSRFRQAIWGPAKWILCTAVVGFFLPWARMTWVDRIIPIPFLAGLARFGIFVVLVTLLVSGRQIVAVMIVKPLWFKGDYDGALRWLQRLSFGRPSAQLLDMEGTTHGLANRPADAEVSIRKALALSGGRPRRELAGLLGSLGESLGDQRRFDEAAKCLEGSIRLGDNVVGSARIDLAELLLKQGAEPSRALQLIEEALQIAKGPVAAKVAPMRAGLRAWALALLGRRHEADEAIARAMEVRREPYAAMFASTRCYAAMAFVAMDCKEKAIEQFRAARDADPRGKYGALALRQLQELAA